jgi:Ser/Thr protein kinase RdoA (MazF antagonist)
MSLLNNSIFSSTPPALSLDDIHSVVQEHYGLKISPDIVLLGSERDQNAIICTDGIRLVFRVTNRAESPDVTHLQTCALMHVQRAAPGFPIQHLVPTLDGRTEIVLGDALGGNVVRLMTYLDGTPMSSIKQRTTIHRERVGEALGGLAVALKGFTHPSVNHDLIWNVVKASRVRELLDKIESPRRRDLARHFLDQFEKYASNRLHLLRSQVIHNDLNPHNIIFEREESTKVTGVLDFGDIILSPIIVDVAVAASSQMISASNPLEGPGDVIRGFNSVLALRESELDLVFDLMAARLVLNVTITGWRASLYPGIRDYILKNNKISWDTLEAFEAVDRKQAAEYFKSICPCPEARCES